MVKEISINEVEGPKLPKFDNPTVGKTALVVRASIEVVTSPSKTYLICNFVNP